MLMSEKISNKTGGFIRKLVNLLDEIPDMVSRQHKFYIQIFVENREIQGVISGDAHLGEMTNISTCPAICTKPLSCSAVG